MNFTTHEIISFYGATDTNLTNLTTETECNDFYIMGLTILTAVVALVSECMSLSKCGGESNGIIHAIKNCLKKEIKEKEQEKV